MQVLIVGMSDRDGMITVLDEDRLCYQVRSNSKGAVGVRTISKALLAEWVDAVAKNPNLTSSELREALCGHSEIDKFEYGYAGTLAKMAKMVLGQIPVVCPNAEDTRRKDFYDWMVSIGKAATYAKDVSKSYLPSISNDPKPPSKSMWHGLREYLYNEKPTRRIYEVNSCAELNALYAGIDRIFGSDSTPGTFDPQRFNDCWTWAHDPANHNSVSAAWNLYKQFMQWREEGQKKQEEPQATLPAADRLSIALKVFAEKRYETEWQDKTRKDGYQSIYDMAAMTPEQIAAGSLDDFYNDFLLKIWAFKNGGSRRYGQLDEAGRKVYRQFVVDLKTQLKSFDAYFPPDPKCPDGMGVGVLTELMMRFWPKSCCNYNASLIHEALVTLHMAEGDFVWPKTPSVYQDFMGKCATILLKMEQMKLPRRSDPGNDEPPDYITVNEFLWFVREYKDTISKECEAKMMKKADYSQAASKPAGKNPKVDFGNAEDVVLLRLAAALRAKPFAILAGHSGTGKSRMVRKLAYMTCARGGYRALLEGADGKPAATPGNFCMVQVKPNWHDSTDLLGYYSEIGSAFRTTDFVKFICKAYAYPDVPFFVCLDEMNLAPVEQYFAEYLSAIESRKVKDDAEFLDGNGDEKTGPKVITDTLLDKSVWKSASDLGCEFTQSAYWVEKHGLTIPRNLFVVGTVNMDESTNQFSRKVLDRAFTLEMTDADFEHFGEQSPEPSYDDYAGDNFVEELLAGKLFASDLTTDHKLKPTQVTNLNKLKPILADTSFVVAYRFANEYALYEDALEKMLSQFDSSTGAGDASAGTSAGAAEAPAADGATQSATGADGAAQPAAADGTQQSGAEGAGNSQGAASPSAKPEAFDDMILMKLLPRITGDEELVLKIFAGDESAKLDDANVKGLAGLLEKKGASFKKMKEIVKRGGTSLTFWP